MKKTGAINNSINGKTPVLGLIGAPIEHTLSPAIHNTLAELTGISCVYAAFPVTAAALKDAVAGAHALGIKGLNVTIPYKKEIIPYLEGLDENAARIGAVNTIKYTPNGYMGYNTDITGVIRTFQKNNVDIFGKSALIIGAGGGAYASAFAAAKLGARRIYIANRTNNNSDLLASRLKKYYNSVEVCVIGLNEYPEILGEYFILQATPVGMDGVSSPVGSLEIVKNSSGVFDIIYSPQKTKILRDAEAFGKTAVNGMDMLIYQAVRAFEIWNEVEIANEYVSGLFERMSEFLIANV